MNIEGKVKRRKERKEQSKEEVVRIGTLNVGKMTGRATEIVDLMQRRKMNILCIQETKSKGGIGREVG